MFEKAKLFLTAKRPEILLAGGLVAIGAGVVLACNASRKLDKVLDETRDNIDTAREELEGIAAEKAVRKERLNCVWKLTKMYAGPSILIVGGTACVCASHKDMSERLEGATTALASTAGAFAAYRGRVRDELGDPYDKHFMYGTKSDELEIPEWTDEDGRVHPAETRVYSDTIDGDEEQFGLEFDERSIYWEGLGNDPQLITSFLQNVQSNLESELVANKYLFDYRIKEALGLKKDIKPRDMVNGFIYKGLPKDASDGTALFELGIFNAYDRKRRLEREGYATKYLLLPTSYGRTSTYILEDFDKKEV